MAEIRRVFSAGRMNKDIDERLLHPGEYRDALNVGVGNSESSDIGAVENLKGNELKAFSQRITGGEEVEIPLTNATTVGAIRYDLEEKIYWFVNSNEGDFVLEYDQTADDVSVVLSDRNGVLGLSADYLITGINILGSTIYWTDNNSEPKKLNIDKFKTASEGSISHTQIYGRDFVEDDITVIKKSPLSSPELTVSETLRIDGGSFITSSQSNFNNVSVADVITVEVASSGLAYIVGDRVSFTTQNEADTVQVTGVIESIVGVRWTVRISTIGDVDGLGSRMYSINVTGNDVIFELKFPRFAYRWRYEDGEYSVFSPFTEVAFIPGTYEYNSEKGYNLAMTNNIRNIMLSGFDTPPDDVVEVDLLYKQSDTTQVYTVETIPVDQASAEVSNEQIYAIVQDDQLLRPYDNVPRKAKAQEVIANRLVYGNYVHNYDVNEDPEFQIELSSRESETPQSVKTLRTYQFGVVYQDKYGRQTPVLSNESGAYQVPVETSDNTTQFRIGLNNNAPDWATHYKFYVKETATEYYNLALDRYYTGDDGFVWCSFPSSEFNKVNEDSYLILKKQHSAGGAVKSDDARYKILDIRTEAPDFLTRQDRVLANIDYNSTTDDGESSPTDTTIVPVEGGIRFSWNVNPDSTYYSQISGGTVRWSDGTNQTAEYEISDVTDNANTTGDLIVIVTTQFTADDIAIINGSSPTIRLSVEEREQLPEFIGRFFVKIVRNAAFDVNVIETSRGDVEPEYGVIDSTEIYDRVQPAGPGSNQREFFYDFREEVRWQEGRNTGTPQTRPQGVGIRAGSNRVDISYSGTEPNGFRNPQWSNEFGDHLGRTGTYIRFVDGGDVYKIISVEHIAGPNLQSRGNRNGPSSTGLWFIGRAGLGTTSFKRWSLTLDKAVDPSDVPNLTEVISQDVNGPSTALTDSIEVLRDITEASRTSEGGTPYVSDPAIFETEPTGDDALDIYYETQENFNITEHGQTNTLKWFNCFSFGNGVESDRIRDDFNGVRIDKGPRVSATIAEQFRMEHRPSGLIWSGIFNSTTGINNTNQFVLALGIQKELQPLFGSIQRLHARDTNLVTFCEDKVLRILADKDALFNADGSTNVTASNNVLGQTTPFTGEYGISKNPESFATYGHRIYFSDKNRGVVLRLSQDGITEISSKGLTDYFRDLFMTSTGSIIGSYNDYHDVFNISLGGQTITYDESSDGWTSRKSFIPEWGLTLNNRYYTWNNSRLWAHNSSNVPRNNFYGIQYNSAVVFIFNDTPGSVKNFKTISYEGTRPKSTITYNQSDTPECTDTEGGWYCPVIITDQQVGSANAFLSKEGKWFTDISVLGGLQAVSEVNNIFSDSGIDGPILDDESVAEMMENAGTASEDNPFTEDLDDAEMLGDIPEMIPDPNNPGEEIPNEVLEVDENNDSVDDQEDQVESTITITLR